MHTTQFTHTSIADIVASNSGSDVVTTPIEGMYLMPIRPARDERGFFSQVCQIPSLPVDFTIKQINHAHSKQFVARGYHAEQWNKLVTVTHGFCFVSIADIRPGSSTFGQVISGYIGYQDEANDGSTDHSAGQFMHAMPDQATVPPQAVTMFLPSGVGNSVCVLSSRLDYLYAVDKLYQERDPSGDQAISLFDPQIGTTWPISPTEMILSQRDLDAVNLSDLK